MLTEMPPADSPKMVTFFGIAAERGNVFLHPLETGDLIQQPVISRNVIRGFGAQLRMREKTELPDAIVNADEHHAFLGQFLAAVARIGRGTGGETAAVNPDQHGNAVFCRFRRRPDIQIQTVFAQPLPLLERATGRICRPDARRPNSWRALARASGGRRRAAWQRGCRDKSFKPSSETPCTSPCATLTGAGCCAKPNPAVNVKSSVAAGIIFFIG